MLEKYAKLYWVKYPMGLFLRGSTSGANEEESALTHALEVWKMSD